MRELSDEEADECPKFPFRVLKVGLAKPSAMGRMVALSLLPDAVSKISKFFRRELKLGLQSLTKSRWASVTNER